jgi:membrane protease YdiL (CAAX protease family)
LWSAEPGVLPPSERAIDARGSARGLSDWRSRPRSARTGDGQLLLLALIAAVTGVLLSKVLPSTGSPWASVASLLPLWLGLAAPAALFLSRARPKGLLRFRATDLVWGIGLGLALRLVQGVLERADLQPFPIVQTVGGPFSIGWWLEQVVASGVVAPVVEEFFFRAVVLVTIYRLLRREIGAVAAGAAALLCSAGAFVLLHETFALLSVSSAVQLFLVGSLCAAVVLLTGRIWGAVIAHVIYNVTFLTLSVVGSLLR